MPTIQTEEQNATYLINEAIRKYRERNPKRSKEQALGVLVSQVCCWTPSEVYEVASSAFEDSKFHTFNAKFEELWKEEQRVDKQNTNKPDFMKKITFVEKFTHLQNWFPHLTLEETINLSKREN